VLEYIEDQRALLQSLRSALKPGGVLVMLAPQGPALFGSLDRRLGHKRRYRPADARTLLERDGFTVKSLYQINKAGAPPWWLYGKLFGSGNINKPVLKLFDKTVWLWRRIDGLLPWPGLSLIVVARNTGPSAGESPIPPQATTQRLALK
jgi:hypothetical protein